MSRLQLLLRRALPLERAELASDAISSANNRLFFSARRIHGLRGIVTSRIEPNFDSWKMFDFEDEQSFSATMLDVQWHVVEAIHHLRSIAESLSYAVYCLTDQRLATKLDPRQVGVRSLAAHLAENDPFRQVFAELSDSEDFEYLCDLDNAAKHRKIVRPAITMRAEARDPLTSLVFPAFPIGKNPDWLPADCVGHAVHPSKPIEPYLTSAWYRAHDFFTTVCSRIDDDVQATTSLTK